MIENFEPVITAMLMGAAYSLFWYVNKVADPTDPTKAVDFDPYPVAATIIVGAAVGVYSSLTGGELTQTSIGVQLLTYGALIAGIERLGKTLVRYVKSKGWV